MVGWIKNKKIAVYVNEEIMHGLTVEQQTDMMTGLVLGLEENEFVGVYEESNPRTLETLYTLNNKIKNKEIDIVVCASITAVSQRYDNCLYHLHKLVTDLPNNKSMYYFYVEDINTLNMDELKLNLAFREASQDIQHNDRIRANEIKKHNMSYPQVFCKL